MYWCDPMSLEPVYEIPLASGKGMTDRISIDRAKQLDLLPRVTGIIADVLGAGWALQQYHQKNAAFAAEHLAREEGECDDDYFERVSTLAGREARKRRDRGTQVHLAVSRYLFDGEASEDPCAFELCKTLSDLMERVDARDITSEHTLGDRSFGYVGTPDIYIGDCDLWALANEMQERPYPMPEGRGEAVLDLKTTDLAKYRKPYREHLYQFGGYANLCKLGSDALFVQWYADPWTARSLFVCHQDTERWKEAFNCLYRAWLIETGFDLPL